MDSNYLNIESIIAKIITDKPVMKTPYQVKGVLMKQFSNEEIIPMLDGSYRNKFLYPRVQVKILDDIIYIIGVNQGVSPVKKILKNLKALDFGNITFEVTNIEIEEGENKFQPTSGLISYKFVTPWVALNQATGNKYKSLEDSKRPEFLNKLLGQNLVFISREMGIELEKNIFSKVILSSLAPSSVDENHWGAFDGEFQTNFVLPSYIGIGNGITRGYGALLSSPDPEDLLFNDQAYKELAIKANSDNSDSLSGNESILKEIDVKKVPRPKKSKPNKKFKPRKKTKKIFSEEFDIQHEKRPRKKTKSASIDNSKKTSKPKNSSEEVNYNSEEYHGKTHKF